MVKTSSQKSGAKRSLAHGIKDPGIRATIEALEAEILRLNGLIKDAATECEGLRKDVQIAERKYEGAAANAVRLERELRDMKSYRDGETRRAERLQDEKNGLEYQLAEARGYVLRIHEDERMKREAEDPQVTQPQRVKLPSRQYLPGAQMVRDDEIPF